MTHQKISFYKLLILFVGFSSSLCFAAETPTTHRIPQFSNEKVTVWETIIYPSDQQKLTLHRHEHDRVIVAFDSGTLKVTNDKGQSHLLQFEKDKAYYLTKDIPGELHTDINITDHPIKVLVIEFNN